MTFTPQLLENLLHQPEGPALDFKLKQYPFRGANEDGKSELLKDILAMANSWRLTTAYILIGVKEVKGSRSEIVGVQEHLDDAELHQFVNSKTQRLVDFSYLQFPIEGVEIGVIQIPLQERPIFLTKLFGKLVANEVKVRDGSSTRTANPDEIAKMGTERALSGTPQFILEWADADEHTTFPTPMTFKTVDLSPPLPSTDVPLREANSYFSVHNQDYADDLIDHVSDDKFYVPLGFRLVNKSGVAGKRIRFAGYIVDTGELNLKEWLTDLPLPFLDIGVPVVSSDMFRRDEEAEISIRQLNDKWEIDVDFGNVRPRDTVWTGCNIYFGAEKTTSFVLQGELRGDNLPEPIKCELEVRFEVEKRHMTMEDIVSYQRGI